MPTEGEEAVANIAARLNRVPGRRGAVQGDAAGGRRRRATSPRAQIVEVAKQCDIWTDPARRQLLPRARRSARGRRGARRRPAPGRGGGHRGDRRVRRLPARGVGPAWAGEAGRRPRALPLASQYFLGAKVDLDETYAWGFDELARLESEMRAVAARDRRSRRHDRRRRRRARRRPGAQHPGQGGVPRLDAGTRPTRRSPSCTAPTSTSPSRSGGSRLPGADQRRRHLLHRPERRLHPPRAHVVGGAAGHHGVLHLARGDDGLPRGRPRPSPADRADRGPRRAAQPLAAAAVLGSPATARAGRSTPSG